MNYNILYLSLYITLDYIKQFSSNYFIIIIKNSYNMNIRIFFQNKLLNDKKANDRNKIGHCFIILYSLDQIDLSNELYYQWL